jgi:hypothetical protein
MFLLTNLGITENQLPLQEETFLQALPAKSIVEK